MAKQSARETAVQYVKAAYSPGAELRHRSTGERITLGVQADKASFWVMGGNPPSRRKEDANRIKDLFERVR